MALGSLVLSLLLARLLLWIGRSATTIPYIVEVDPKGGARAVGPAVETYKPSDAQITFHLARFVDNVRSLSIDPNRNRGNERMPITGTFSAVKDGYTGRIRTLTMNVPVRLFANDRKDTDGAPDFRIMSGMTEIGAAWRRTRKGTEETYLSVKLDCPALPQPIWGALLEATDDAPARLVWRRDRRDDG